MTKKSIVMNPLLLTSGVLQKVSFETDPYVIAKGAIRNIQKYCTILLTNIGTDRLHPKFGTDLSALPLMNIHSYAEIRLFITDQVTSATTQFFTIQSSEVDMVPDDVMSSIQLSSIDISDTSKISITLKFVPKTGDSITMSLGV